MAEQHPIPSDPKKQTNAEYQRKRIARKKAAGICVRCSQPALDGMTFCEIHRKDHVKKRARRREQGMCVWCSHPAMENSAFCQKHLLICKKRTRDRPEKGKCRRCRNPPVTGGVHCTDCLKKQQDVQRIRYLKLKDSGTCPNCLSPTDTPGIACTRCRDRFRVKRLALRREVLEAYGGVRCVCCGIELLEFLTLDHPDGDGAQHRREVGGGGTKFYKHLKHLGFPQTPKLVVMCYNCNFARKFGECPCRKLKKP